VQAIASFAIVRYFLTEARDGFHVWKTLVAPIVGGLAQIGACYLLIANRAALSGAGDVLFIRALPWFVIAGFAVGVGVALYVKFRDSDRYALIGSFAKDDPAVHEHHPAGGPLLPAGL
jgi:hypothetical protein